MPRTPTALRRVAVAALAVAACAGAGGVASPGTAAAQGASDYRTAFDYVVRFYPRFLSYTQELPVPAGPFNVMLRVYGPQGSVADGSYRPPGIRSLRLAP